jgi:hypothetical protein
MQHEGTPLMTTASTAKKRVRRAKSAAKRAIPLEINKTNVRKAAKIGAVGAGAWIAGRALWAAARVVVGTALVVAAAAAAATLVPKETQKQIAGNLRGAVLLTRDKILEQTKSLTA